MPEFYDSIHIMLVCSLAEPFGLVSIEAQARGCPVVVSHIDGLPETMRDQNTGILLQPVLTLYEREKLSGCTAEIPRLVFDPINDAVMEPKALNPKHVAQAVVSIISSYQEYSERARVHAISRFGVINYAERIYDSIKKFIS
jgi:glycosyltransferase involved in cell wall biosynthesis